VLAGQNAITSEQAIFFSKHVSWRNYNTK